MKNNNLKEALNIVGAYEAFVLENEESFIEHFCHQNTIDILSVYFSQSHVKIISLLEHGQHVSNTIDIEDFITWVSMEVLKEKI